MKFSENDIKTHTLIKAKTSQPCSVCKEPTKFIDYCYETRCCSTECLEELDKTFNDYISKLTKLNKKI